MLALTYYLLYNAVFNASTCIFPPILDVIYLTITMVYNLRTHQSIRHCLHMVVEICEVFIVTSRSVCAVERMGFEEEARGIP